MEVYDSMMVTWDLLWSYECRWVSSVCVWDFTIDVCIKSFITLYRNMRPLHPSTSSQLIPGNPWLSRKILDPTWKSDLQKIWKIDEHGWKFINHKRRHPLVWSFPGPSGLKITFGPEHNHQLRLHRKSISNPVQQLFPFHVFLSAWRGDQSLNGKCSVAKSARVWFLLPKSAHISTPKSIPIQQGGSSHSKTRWRHAKHRARSTWNFPLCLPGRMDQRRLLS